MVRAWTRIARLLSGGLVGLLAAGCAGQALAFADKPNSAETQRDAQAWLRRVQSAAQQLNYAGVFIYQQASQVRTSRITHIVDGKNEIEKLEILDDLPREFIRRNDEVTFYIPETRTLIVEKRVKQDFFPAIPGGPSAELGAHYQARLAETARVAGYEAQVILLQPKDKLRYGYRLWAERTTGLLLRSQTLNEDGLPIEQIGFAQLALHHVDKAQVRPSYANTQSWQVEKSPVRAAHLAGWSVGGVPPGFRKVREFTRTVWEDAGADGSPAAKREVTQVVFSDGLAAISVFIEPAGRGRVEGYMQQGAMNILGRRHGDYWLTVLGEVPLAAIKQVAASITYKPESKPK